MKIVFTYNSRRPAKEADGKLSAEPLEYDEPATIEGIKAAIQANGHEVTGIEADENCFEILKKLREEIDLVFNIAEGVPGDARESQVPTFCEVLGIPFSHSGPAAHALSLNKSWAKTVAASEGARVPKSAVINENFNIKNLRFPLILKPNKEGSSMGIFDANVVAGREALLKRMGELKNVLPTSEIIAEEYIDGREFTVGLLGNDPPEVLPIIEQKFDFLPEGMHHMAGFETKWLYEDEFLDRAYECPADLTAKQHQEIEDTSRKIFKAMEVRDCARIDYRMDKQGYLYFLEINTLPGLVPDEKFLSYFPLAARTAGLSFEAMIGRIIESAAKRYGLNTPALPRTEKLYKNREIKPGKGRYFISPTFPAKDSR